MDCVSVPSVDLRIGNRICCASSYGRDRVGNMRDLHCSTFDISHRSDPISGDHFPCRVDVSDAADCGLQTTSDRLRTYGPPTSGSLIPSKN